MEKINLGAEIKDEAEQQNMVDNKELEEENQLTVTPSLDELEDEILGYKFKNQNLLEEAFIHRSLYYPLEPCVSYQRLEFIGDSVLNLLVAKELYFSYPNFAPGPLTRLRAANVDNEKLARVAVKHGLYRFLRHKNPALDQQLQEFIKDIDEYPVHSTGLIDTPKFLADIVESTIGAIFIDSGFSLDIVWKVLKVLLEPIITAETMRLHPITELQELCQKKGLEVRFVRCLLNEYTNVDIFVDDRLAGTATCRAKKEIAQSRAAKAALIYLKKALGDVADTMVEPTSSP